MKKLAETILVMMLSVTYGLAAQSDKKPAGAAAGSNAAANTRAQANTDSHTISLDSGTQIDAEITSVLNLKKAKPGDSFKMKTLKPVKKQGKEIISKGSTILGHVQQSTTSDNTTKTSLVFDQLIDQKTHATSSLSAVITTITKPVTATAMTQDDAMSNVSSGTSAAPQRGSQSGGLLGGVTQTVGGVAQGVSQTAGGVAGSAGSTVSSTTNATLGSTAAVTGAAATSVGATARGPIQIVNDSTAGIANGSTLTMSTSNAKLESGTRFMLQTTQTLVLSRDSKAK